MPLPNKKPKSVPATPVAENDRIVLKGRSRAEFVELLASPPKPNAKLKAAYKRYKQRIG